MFLRLCEREDGGGGQRKRKVREGGNEKRRIILSLALDFEKVCLAIKIKKLLLFMLSMAH